MGHLWLHAFTHEKENDSEKKKEKVKKAVVHYTLWSITTRVSH
jgi:hypothetical protein